MRLLKTKRSLFCGLMFLLLIAIFIGTSAPIQPIGYAFTDQILLDNQEEPIAVSGPGTQFVVVAALVPQLYLQATDLEYEKMKALVATQFPDVATRNPSRQDVLQIDRSWFSIAIGENATEARAGFIAHQKEPRRNSRGWDYPRRFGPRDWTNSPLDSEFSYMRWLRTRVARRLAPRSIITVAAEVPLGSDHPIQLGYGITGTDRLYDVPEVELENLMNVEFWVMVAETPDDPATLAKFLRRTDEVKDVSQAYHSDGSDSVGPLFPRSEAERVAGVLRREGFEVVEIVKKGE